MNGVTRNYIAHILSNGTVDLSWNPNANGWVHALAVSVSTVYAGGLFTSIGGRIRNRIAAIDASTGQATSWSPNANDWVHALAVSVSTVYAGGDFTMVGGRVCSHFAQFGLEIPIISSILPTSGIKDSTLTISGSAFGSSRGTSYVSFGNVKASSYHSWFKHANKGEGTGRGMG